MMEDFGTWVGSVGRMHPLVVHLPIGILFVAFVIEGLSLFQRFANLRVVLPLLWIFCAATAIVSCMAGLALAEEGGFDEETLAFHKWLGIGVAIMSVVMSALWTMKIKKGRYSTFIPALISFLVISVTGHLGGTMTHGEGYLTEFLFPEQDEESASRPMVLTVTNPTQLEEAVVYRDLVRPVLQEKCYGCHGAKRQKGKLRLDEYHYILAGGKSDSTLIPGNAEDSELYRRLILPESDKKRMPPPSKPQLTKEEIALLKWWISDAEASGDRRVEEVRTAGDMTVLFASLGPKKEFVSETASEIPSDSLAEAPADALKKLSDAGIVVSRFSNDLPYISVNCVNANQFGDKETELLLPLKDYIIWLKAGNTGLTDAGLQNITKLHRLSRLNVENTKVSDEGISGISNLPELRYLNLVGTNVSSKSIPAFAKCAKLKRIYLWQTKFSKEDAGQLATVLPHAEINIGEQE